MTPQQRSGDRQPQVSPLRFASVEMTKTGTRGDVEWHLFSSCFPRKHRPSLCHLERRAQRNGEIAVFLFLSTKHYGPYGVVRQSANSKAF